MAAEQANLDVALLVGADWLNIDPDLCDRVIERHLANPPGSRIAFTQAPPGACGCVLARSLLNDLAAAPASSGVFAGIGGVMGYLPFAPIVDLINLPECVAVDPVLRDAGQRLDSGSDPSASPRELVVSAGRHGGWIDSSRVLREIDDFPTSGSHPVLTLRGGDGVTAAIDPLDHPDLARIVDHAHHRGLSVHLRTPLTGADFDAGALISCPGLAIVSVDLLAATPETYVAITGRTREDFSRAIGRFEELLAARNARGTWSIPWLVPRITRCDAAYADIETFHRQWLTRCGWVAIDPLESARPGERIAPLPMPEWVQRKRAALRKVIA
jgi:hypothetical protein